MTRRASLFFALLCALPLAALQPSLEQGDWLCEGLGCGFVADVNGDGLDDLLDMQTRTMRFNLGGAFGESVPLTGVADNESLSTANDYNGDGFVDLVLWPNRGPHNEGPNRMAYGDGRGGFRTGFFPTEYGGVGQQAPRDYNQDGKADLVLVKFEVSSNNDDVWTRLSFLLGNGDGTFVLDQQLRFLATAYPYMAFGDYNEDGQLDLVRTGLDTQSIYVHLADKKGRFGNARPRFMGVWTGQLQAGDVNGDGHTDVVVASSSSAGQIMHVLFNDGRARFNAVAELSLPAWGPLVADIYPGGGDEITIPHDSGHLVVYSGVGNALHPVASTHVGGSYYFAKLLRFSSPTSYDFIVTDRVFNVIPHTNRSKIVFVDGELPEVEVVSSAPRRTRSLGRGVGVNSYDAIVTGACAPASLNEFAFTREGMFFDFEPRADGTEIRAAMVRGTLVTRVTIGERLLTGNLTVSANNAGIRGYLYDRTTNSCGATGRVLVDAARVQ